MFIEYTATRELVGSGDAEIEVAVSNINRMMQVEGSESVSISGESRESQLDRLEFRWPIVTVPVHIDNLPRWREFAASVANGETFTFDAHGTEASADNPITASMIRGSFKESRIGGPYVQFSFEVLERS